MHKKFRSEERKINYGWGKQKESPADTHADRYMADMVFYVGNAVLTIIYFQNICRENKREENRGEKNRVERIREEKNIIGLL